MEEYEYSEENDSYYQNENGEYDDERRIMFGENQVMNKEHSSLGKWAIFL